MVSKPIVGVVILNYKLAEQVIACVESVLKSHGSFDLRIVVVDNDSGDDIEQRIAKYKGVFFVKSDSNTGYSGGNNLGIKKAMEIGVDFVFVLNPDTTILPDTVEKLLKGISEYNAGIVGPKIYFSKTKNIWFAGGELDLKNVLGSNIGVDQVDKGQFDEAREVDFITGAAMLVSRNVFEKIGLFDERYFLYYEDSDFCYRAKVAQFKVVYYPEAVIYHQNAQTTGLGSPLQDYFITRNRMLFAKKFLSARVRFALIREALRNYKYPARRRALWDFVKGNFGKGSFL